MLTKRVQSTRGQLKAGGSASMAHFSGAPLTPLSAKAGDHKTHGPPKSRVNNTRRAVWTGDCLRKGGACTPHHNNGPGHTHQRVPASEACRRLCPEGRARPEYKAPRLSRLPRRRLQHRCGRLRTAHAPERSRTGERGRVRRCTRHRKPSPRSLYPPSLPHKWGGGGPQHMNLEMLSGRRISDQWPKYIHFLCRWRC